MQITGCATFANVLDQYHVFEQEWQKFNKSVLCVRPWTVEQLIKVFDAVACKGQVIVNEVAAKVRGLSSVIFLYIVNV